MARISLAFVGKCQFIKMKAIFRQHLREFPDLGQMFENAGTNYFD